jgi:hypothetical protein
MPVYDLGACMTSLVFPFTPTRHITVSATRALVDEYLWMWLFGDQCFSSLFPFSWDFMDGPWPTIATGLSDDLITDRGIDKRFSWPVQGAVGRFGVMMSRRMP